MEEVELAILVIVDMENTIDVIFTQSDDLNVVVVSILNLASNKDLERVIEFIYNTLNPPILTVIQNKNPSFTKSSPPKVVIKTDIKTQNFVNDDNLEIDIDFSDGDSEEEEDDDGTTEEGGGGEAPKQESPLPAPVDNLVVLRKILKKTLTEDTILDHQRIHDKYEKRKDPSFCIQKSYV